jgi:hypothetical protein
MFRTYGAQKYDCERSQPLRAGLNCVAPPALSRDSQFVAFQSQVADPESRAKTWIQKSIATMPQRQGSSEKSGAPEARKMVAQPGRAGYMAEKSSSAVGAADASSGKGYDGP